MIRQIKLLIIFGIIASSEVKAEGFTPDQSKALNGLLRNNLALFQSAKNKNVDLVLEMLDESYKGTIYSGNSEAEAVRTQLKAEGEKVKSSIENYEKEVTPALSDDCTPATTILLLSKEQTVNFEFYAWLRNVMLMSDLANASVGRSDALSGEYITQLLRVHEETYKTAGDQHPGNRHRSY